jgi:hypothetical protein
MACSCAQPLIANVQTARHSKHERRLERRFIGVAEDSLVNPSEPIILIHAAIKKANVVGDYRVLLEPISVKEAHRKVKLVLKFLDSPQWPAATPNRNCAQTILFLDLQDHLPKPLLSYRVACALSLSLPTRLLTMKERIFAGRVCPRGKVASAQPQKLRLERLK